MKFSFLITTLFLSQIFTNFAHAEIKIQSIAPGGYSNILNYASGGANTSIQIYGGEAGGITAGNCPNRNALSVCNSCDEAVTTPTPCNERMVHDTLKLSIIFSSTTAKGTPRITVIPSGTTTDTHFVTNEPITNNTNVGVTIEPTWAQIKNAIAIAQPNADCTANPCSQTFRVGIDTGSDGFMTGSGDDHLSFTIVYFAPTAAAYGAVDTQAGSPRSCTQGLCNYTLMAGDEKAHIDYSNVVDTGGIDPIRNAIFICSETTDFTQIPFYVPGLKRATVTNGQISEDFIEGFSNGTTYSCISATETTTGNIGLYGGYDNTLGIMCPNDDVENSDTCHQFTPDAVYGLFKEKQNCFIATAAYGSPWMEQVSTLRKFRSKFLMSFAWGRKFVSWYYHNAPPIAQWISETPERRLGARIVLTPLFVSAYLSVHWPKATLALIIGLVLFCVFYRPGKRLLKPRIHG